MTARGAAPRGSAARRDPSGGAKGPSAGADAGPARGGRESSQPRDADLPCERCGARCCRYLATEIDTPRSKRDLDDIRWYLLHRDVSVYIDPGGAWFLAFESPCRELDDAGRCQRYAERPQLCRSHGQDAGSCEYYGPLHAVRFTTVAEFESWLTARGLDWRDRRRRQPLRPTSRR